MSGMKSNGDGSGAYLAYATDNAEISRTGTNCARFVMTDGGNSGTFALDRAEGSAKIHDKSVDGREALVVGNHSDEVKKRAMDKVFDSGDGVKIGIKFSDDSEKFWSSFKKEQSIYDIRARINKDDERKVSYIMHSETKKKIGENTTVEDLLKEDWLKNLTAVLKNAVPNDSSV